MSIIKSYYFLIINYLINVVLNNGLDIEKKILKAVEKYELNSTAYTEGVVRIVQ